jgi:plastocyanin
MYDKIQGRAKLWLTCREGNMGRFALAILSLLLLLTAGASSAAAQRKRVIRLEAVPDKDIYRFTPARITARPGDVLVFQAVRGAPHSIVFEGADLSEATHEAINGAMGRRTGDLSSPLLTSEGAEYRIVVPRVAPGVYHFYCLPHRAYNMRGELEVTK